MSPYIITVAQQKGGAGKSTLAAHIAVYFSSLGKKTALLDIDPQGTLTHWYRVREQRDDLPEDDIMCSAISGWRVQSELRAVRHKYDIIVVDSSPHAQTETKTAIREADAVVIPTQPSPADLWATQTVIDAAEKEKVPCIILLNRVAANANITQVIADRLPPEYLLKETLGNRVAYAGAMMDGKTVFETGASSPASNDMRSVCEAIARRLENSDS